MFTSMLTLKNIALMLMLMHEIFLISTYIISIQLYSSLCSHWGHMTLYSTSFIFKRMMSMLMLMLGLILAFIYIISIQPFSGLCSHWACRTLCGVLFTFKRMTSMLMHTLGRMLYSAPQMNLVLHFQRKSRRLYGKLPILRKKTSMRMLMHGNSLILSCPMFRQLCSDLYFHWEDRALYILKFYNHGRMTSISMPMHEILLSKTIYIVSRLCSALRFHRKSSIVCSFLTIHGKITTILCSCIEYFHIQYLVLNFGNILNYNPTEYHTLSHDCTL